jgi:hypothetical protein
MLSKGEAARPCYIRQVGTGILQLLLDCWSQGPKARAKKDERNLPPSARWNVSFLLSISLARVGLGFLNQAEGAIPLRLSNLGYARSRAAPKGSR